TRGAWTRLPRANGYWPTALRSLADAEVGEDGGDDLFGGVPAGDIVQKFAGPEHVRSHHVGAEPVAQRLRATAQRGRRFPRQAQLPLDSKALFLAAARAQTLLKAREQALHALARARA